jgi:hypothetical protein
MRYIKFSLLLLIIIATVSCRKNTNLADAEKITVEWIGKKIVIPPDIRCSYMGHDTLCPKTNTPYKVLPYTDSMGCTGCKLQLYKWSAIMKEADSLMTDKISFHFYFQPKDEKELQFLLKRDNFKQAVYIDRESRLYAANKLPDNMNYQCFLLDKDNKVILIGNPTINPKIWDLYKQAVSGDRNEERTDDKVTTVEAEQSEIELQDTKIRETSLATFILKNTGDTPLLIKDISASCGCTVPEWDKQPVKPREKTAIKVKVTPDVAGHFRKTVTVFCNIKGGSIQLAVKSEVKN